jgi:hypothetical protein
VAGTDRIALMQERLAARLADRMDLRVMECPGAPEPIVEALWWHQIFFCCLRLERLCRMR